MKTIEDWIEEKTASIPEIGTVPMDQAGLCWDMGNDSQVGEPVRDFHVVDLREAEKPGTEESKLWDAASSTNGACIDDWVAKRSPRATPLGVFAEFGFDGSLPTGRAFFDLLCQFAKIEGCGWAVHMLAALQMGHLIGPSGEELRL